MFKTNALLKVMVVLYIFTYKPMVVIYYHFSVFSFLQSTISFTSKFSHFTLQSDYEVSVKVQNDRMDSVQINREFAR